MKEVKMTEIKFLNREEQGRFLKAIKESKQKMKVTETCFISLYP